MINPGPPPEVTKPANHFIDHVDLQAVPSGFRGQLKTEIQTAHSAGTDFISLHPCSSQVQERANLRTEPFDRRLDRFHKRAEHADAEADPMVSFGRHDPSLG